jgi:hypothetical protein
MYRYERPRCELRFQTCLGALVYALPMPDDDEVREDPDVARLRAQLAAAERKALLRAQVEATEEEIRKIELDMKESSTPGSDNEEKIKSAPTSKPIVPVALKKTEHFKSAANHNWPKYQLDKLGKAIFVLSLLGFLFIHMGNAGTHRHRASLVQGGITGGSARTRMMNEMDGADSSVQITSYASNFFNLVFVVCLIIWAWRATTNLDVAGLPHRWKRGWAIGGWFTPFMFFFVPYQVVSDAWKNAPGAENRPGRNRLWLFGFIATFLGFALNQIADAAATSAMNNFDLDAFYVADIIWVCASGLLGAGAILIGIAIKQISARHVDPRLHRNLREQIVAGERKTELHEQVEAAEAELQKINANAYGSPARLQKDADIENYHKRKMEKRAAYKAKLRSYKKEKG